MSLYENFGLFINGDWVPAVGGETRPAIDPATEETIGTLAAAGTADLDRALAAVKASRWADVPGWERSGVLRATAQGVRDRLEQAARDMSRETGKPIAESRGEMNAVVDQFEWYADEARRIFGHTLDGRDAGVSLDVRFEPIGPVAAFTAWNFPGLLPARKIAAALAAGCPIILKPSEEAPSAAFHIAAAARAAGLPAGTLNVVTGDSAEISSYLIASPIIKKVSFTGSVPVGKLLLRQCAEGVKKVSMELGGHAPVLVFPDADPVKAGETCARTKFRNAGQVCISPSRFFVHEDIYEPFAESFTKVASDLKIGAGSDDGVEIGPCANARGRDRVQALVADALEQGAELLTGGAVPPEFNRGFFFQPTVLGRVPDSARVMQDEPFGPIAPIATFRDFGDVVARANSVPFGLAGYVFTNSLSLANRASRALEVGMVGVNDMLLAAAEAPFGGVKESGMGREGGKLGIHDYLQPKYTKMRFA